MIGHITMMTAMMVIIMAIEQGFLEIGYCIPFLSGRCWSILYVKFFCCFAADHQQKRLLV